MHYIFVSKNGHKMAKKIENRKQYFAYRNKKANVANFKAARQGDEKSKKHLVQFSYNDLLPDGVLAGSCHPSSYFAHDIDTGDETLCKETAQKLLEMKEDLGLMELSVSANWGLHAVFRRQMGKTILENQVRVSMLTQTEMDASAHDLQRVMFTGPADEDILLYLDDALFEEPLSEMESAAEFELLCEREQRGEEQLPPKAKGGDKHYRPWEDTLGAETPKSGAAVPAVLGVLAFKGIPYTEIINEYWKRTGGEPQEGERNVRLHQLAVNLRTICDNNSQLLMQIMPRQGLSEQELQQIVNSACKEQPRGISRIMREITQQGKAVMDGLTGGDIEQMLWQWGRQIETLADDFPLLRDVCDGLKANQYPAAIVVGGGLLMTLMTRCTYRYYHRPMELRRLNCAAFIIGDPASGKSFATNLYKQIAAPIRAADRSGKQAVNKWKEESSAKGANKDKQLKPKGIIRIHPARTSNQTFITDMINAVEIVDGEEMQLHMLTFDSELDNTIAMQKGGSWIDKTSMELKAFHNEEDGQAYSNKESIQEDFNVTWNYIYTGTPMALKHKVNPLNFGSGLATRLTVVPMPSTNFEMLEYDEDYNDNGSDDRLREWAFKLDRMKGELNVKKLVRELYEWTSRRMAEAKENNSKAQEMLLKRCGYHGLNYSLPFIVMRHWNQMRQDGSYWCGDLETDEKDWQLCELLTNIQYACQHHYFMAMAEKYYDDQQRDVVVNTVRKSRTVEAFNSLPTELTSIDVARCFGYEEGSSSARTKIKNLVKDGLIEFLEEFTENGRVKSRYRKTGKVMI